MRLLGWLRNRRVPENRQAHEWRTACLDAAERLDDSRIRALAAELDGWSRREEDIEIEREMLGGLRDLLDLTKAANRSGLPVVQTGHRVVGTEVCHFSAPVSMPDDGGQPSGRLLLTSRRAIFVGGARGVTVPWHAVGKTLQVDRDLVLIRRDREELHRFRCNSFSDAFRGAFMVRELVAGVRRSGL
jgi:hypothetical protein